MKSFGPVVILMLTAFGGTAAGQAMVGYGLGAARAATTAAPAAALGKTIAKSWKNLDSVSKKAESSSVAAVAKPAVHYEDPSKIEDGISYSDLVKRFGPPNLQITLDDGSRTLTYLGKSGNAELVVRDGKVGSVDVRRVQTAALSN